MSQENVDAVRRWLNAWVEWFDSERDSDRFDQLVSRYVAPSVTYEEDPVWPDAGLFHGRHAVARRFIEYVDLVHIEGTSVGEVIDAGDVVVAQVRIAILGGDSGEAVEFLWTYTVRVEDDQVTHFRAWYDAEEALEAAGLRE